MTKHFGFALPLLALPLFAASPASAAEIQIQSQGPVVEITAAQTVQSAPDMATVSGGVTTRAATAVEAMRLNAAAMDKVIASLKKQGIDGKDIQTQGINLNAQWRYNNDQTPPTFLGYDASNRVTVVVRKVERTGMVLDAMVASGANDVSGPAFSIDDDTRQRAEARKLAFAKATAQASDYAKMAGYSSVRLLEINEAVMGGAPMPYMRDAIMVQGTSAKTPVEPGQVGTAVQVTVKYEMVK
jgi:uncharacterized protein YggE